MSSVNELADLIAIKENHGGECKHIVLGGTKGGSGKSTVSCQLAIFATHIYNKKVLFVDLDTTAGTSGFALASRNALLKKAAEVDASVLSRLGGVVTVVKKFDPTKKDNIRKLIEQSANYDLCIYDMGGYSSTVTIDIGQYVDLFLMPLLPDGSSMQTISPGRVMINRINDARSKRGYGPIKGVIFLTNVETTPNDKELEESRDFLENGLDREVFMTMPHGLLLKKYAVMKRIFNRRLGVTEVYPRHEKAVRQLDKFTKSVFRLVGIPVPKQ